MTPLAPDRRTQGSFRFSPLTLSRAVVVLALLYASVVVNPRFMRRMHLGLWLPDVHPAEPGLGVALAILLFGLAGGVRRGQHHALRATFGLVMLELAVQLHLRHWVVSALSVTALAALYASRSSFVGRADPTTRGKVWRAASVSAATSITLGLAATGFAADEAGQAVDLWHRIGYTLLGLVGVPTPITQPETRLADLDYYLLLCMGVISIARVGTLALKSARSTPSVDPAHESRLRAAVARSTEADSLDYFALRDDRAVVWSPAGGACISYRVVGGTALAAGDPVGVRAQWPDAITEFLSQARLHGWAPAVVAASTSGAAAWQRYAGFQVLEFGDEAIIHVDAFTLEGREMRNVRHAAGRAERAGYRVQVLRGAELSEADSDHLRDLIDLWRAGPIERGFTMGLGRFDPQRDPDLVVALAVREDRIEGILAFTPWGHDGLSLDVMRRSPECDSGINELLIVGAIAQAERLGVTRISLNFAAFREAIERSERIGVGPLARRWGQLLKSVSRWSQADTLYRFNAKFLPEWQPRFVGFERATGLPRVAIAYLEAESMLSSPRLWITRRFT